MENLFVNNNGKVLPNDGATIAAGNRSDLYGDGLFETIRIMNGQPINVLNHFNRMIEGAHALKLRIPSYFTPGFFNERIIELTNLSGITEGGKCRICSQPSLQG